jgi:hypothetical protein
MEAVVATVLPLLLVGAAIWAFIFASRQRRRYAQHPEERPTGNRLLVRQAPFIALGAAFCVWGVLRQDPVQAILGGVAALVLGWEAWRQWNRRPK